MKRRRFLAVIFGVIVLSACLVLITDSARAAPKDKNVGTPTQNWDENLSGTARFTVLSAFNNAAVRDNNTGLVWEQAPEAATHQWDSAGVKCVNRKVGNTRGWRLPSVAELVSLIDPSLPAPFVPLVATGGVFTGVQPAFFYWSTTTRADTLVAAWGVSFEESEGTLGAASSHSKTDSNQIWCVRGPMQESVY